MSSVRRSLAISLFGRYLQIGIQLASFVTLARLLTPEDIGLFSVASAAVGIAHVFRDFGVNAYLVQEKHLSEHKIATAFTLTLTLGGTLFSLLFLSAPLIADFYNDQRLTAVFRLLAVNFLIIPFNATSLSLLQREMKFGATFWINTAAALVGFITAVSLAYQGYGYYSLIWSSLSTTFATAVAVSFFRQGGLFHRPTLCEWKAVAAFGSQITVTNITNEIAVNANDLIIGRLLGFAATGIVSRAQGIMYLFHRDITASLRSVAFPAFAKAYRENRDLEHDYIKAVTMLTAFAWPFYGFLGLYAVEALRLFFGPQWDEAGNLVPWFCAAGAISATCSLIPTLLSAIGGVRYLVRLHLIVDPLRVAAFAVVVYLFRSTTAYAVTFLGFFFVSQVLLYHYKNQLLPNRYKPLIAGLAQSLAVSLCTLSLPLLLASHIQFGDDSLFRGYCLWLYQSPEQAYLKAWLLIPLGLLMLPCWLLSLIAFKHPIAEEALFKKIVFYRIGGHRGASS